MQFKEFQFNVDIKKELSIQPITIVQGDNSNVFNITLMDGSERVDLTDAIVKIVFRKLDNTVVLQDVTIVDAIKGMITCKLDMQVSTIVGTVSGEIIVFGLDGEKLTSSHFSFKVRGSLVNENVITSTDSYSALATALAKVNSIANITQPRPVIFDTDWGGDVDDVVAARILLWAEREGLVDIVVVNASVAQDNTTPSIDAYFIEEGRSGLVIGVDHTATDYNISPTYQTMLLTDYPRFYSNIASMEDSTSVYRRAFANATQPIDILSLGFMNCINKFLQSLPDDISPLTGFELVEQNGGTLWVMGGVYPNGHDGYNFGIGLGQANESAEYVINNFPNRIVFSDQGGNVWAGWNIGESDWYPSFDVLAKSLVLYNGGVGSQSWDGVLTVVACYDDFELAGYDPVRGTNEFNVNTGVNTFTENKEGNHYYLVQKHVDRWYELQINSIIEKRAWRYRKLGGQQLERL